MKKASDSKKILYYNWIQFDKENNTGGGVNVYQKNIIDYMIKSTNNEVYFLSSGIYYDIFKRKTYIKKTKNVYGEKCKSYKMYNSKCVAPAKTMNNDLSTYLNDDTTYDVFKKFIEDNGGFDVIHFNNIEGLSSKCLEIKKDFPNIKIIFSIHNYFLFCPQINLFYNGECNCENYQEGKKCKQCLNTSITKNKSIFFYKIDGFCEKIHCYNLSDRLKKILKKIHKNTNNKHIKQNNYNETDSEIFKLFRNKNVERVNKYVDCILAVSNRVREIAINMGIDSDKIHTNYIGTKFAETNINKVNADYSSQYLTIAYMGYFEKMKGFDFLIEALESLPDNISSRIDFKCYAKIKNPEDEEKVNKVKKLSTKLHSSTHYDGYTHSELEEIMSEINLGIVPVIWEDNLPQVAIEFVAHGVPILCSNLGGAQELSKSKYFIFKSGNIEDFKDKLTKIIEDKNLLNEYYNSNMKLVSMKDHIDKLLSFYE